MIISMSSLFSEHPATFNYPAFIGDQNKFQADQYFCLNIEVDN